MVNKTFRCLLQDRDALGQPPKTSMPAARLPARPADSTRRRFEARKEWCQEIAQLLTLWTCSSSCRGTSQRQGSGDWPVWTRLSPMP